MTGHPKSAQRLPGIPADHRTDRKQTLRLVLLGLALALPLCPGRLLAQSTNYGAAVLPAPGMQSGPPLIVGYGNGSSTVAWTDYRNVSVWEAWQASFSATGFRYPFSIVAHTHFSGPRTQRVAAIGTIAPLSAPALAIVDGTSDYDIWTVATGSGGYPVYGMQEVCAAAGEQTAPCILAPSDVNNNVILAWQDARLGAANLDIFAQRAGMVPPLPGWVTNGVSLCSASGNQQEPVICTDGNGGAIVAWVDYRGASADIYAQWIDNTAALHWTATGKPVCTVSGAQNTVQIVSDGAGGALLAWVDYRNGNADIYAQRLNPLGNPMLPVNGVAVCAAAGDQTSLVSAPDNEGNIYLTWVDTRHGQHIYAERLNKTGDTMWSVGEGAPVCTWPGLQSAARIAADSAGIVVVWEDQRNPTRDIYAQRMESNYGSWTLDGIPVCTAPGDQTVPAVASAGGGSAVVTWLDARVSPTNVDPYVQRLSPTGTLLYSDSDRPQIAAVRDVPGDQGGHVALRFTPGGLDNRDARVITGFRIWRRVEPSASVLSQVSPLETSSATAGRYLARRDPRPHSAATNYWEAVATLPAEQLPAYGYVSKTTQDSVASGNPSTAFFITALTDDPYAFYESAIDSGYSVDNLAPESPTPFQGTLSSGSIVLHWGPNSESDLSGYRLYRGTSEGFTPGPGTEIAAQPDTGYADPWSGTAYFYKLSAVDVHGNESGFALLRPAQISNVAGDPETARFWLGQPFPNPMLRSASIRFGLPRESHVTLTLFEPSGRRIRELVDQTLIAGDHTVTWDGLDDTSRRAPSGIYYYRLAGSGRTLTGKLVVVH